jgi:excisionase family DNA binding protein
MTAPVWVKADVIAEMTGFHPVTVLRMAREGRIPAQKVGRLTRFDPAAVQQWMTEQPKASA